jgi:spermidine synthase
VVCCLPAAQRGNVIAMGFKQPPLATRWDELRERARELEAAYGLEFPQFVGALKQLNPHGAQVVRSAAGAGIMICWHGL